MEILNEGLETSKNSQNPETNSHNIVSPNSHSNPDKSLEEKQNKKSRTGFQWKESSPLKFLGKLGAVGGMIGFLITVNTWFSERPNLQIEIERVDLVQFIQESEIKKIEKDVINQLIALEYDYLDITEDYVNNLIQQIYNLLETSDGMFIKYPEDDSISSDPLKDFTDNLTAAIEHFNEKVNDLFLQQQYSTLSPAQLVRNERHFLGRTPSNWGAEQQVT